MFSYHSARAFLVAQMVKNLPAVQEVQVQYLGQEDPLEKGMVPHLSICLENSMARGAWWTHGVTKNQTLLRDQNTHTHTHTIPLPPLHSNPNVPTWGEGC